MPAASVHTALVFAQAVASPSLPTLHALDEVVVLGPRFEDGARVRLAPVEASILCSSSGCTSRVRLVVTNETERTVVGAIWIGGAVVDAVRVDGEVRAAPPLPRDLEGTYAPRFRGPLPPSDPAESRIEVPHGFAIDGPKGKHVVEIDLSMPLRDVTRGVPERVIEGTALETRHLILGSGPHMRGASLVVVTPAKAIDAARTDAGLAYAGTIRASAPRAWSFEIRGDRACPQAVTGLASCAGPDVATRDEADGTVTHETWASPLGTDLVLGARVYERTSTVVANGGPFIGAGWAFGRDDGFRARLGWDVGLGSTGGVLASIAADSDLSRRLTVAPVVALASRGALLRPSVGAGLGVPVQVLPEARVGGRVQVDVHLSAFGIVTWVDVLAAPGPVTATASVLGEVSF